jgi:hypothetical protein
MPIVLDDEIAVTPTLKSSNDDDNDTVNSDRSNKTAQHSGSSAAMQRKHAHLARDRAVPLDADKFMRLFAPVLQ